MDHVLVVGGTGMLRGFTLHVARRARCVSVVAKRRRRLEALVAETENVFPLSVDWRDTEALRALLRSAIDERGAFDPAVCWIHSTAPDAPFVVAEVAAPCRLFQVFGGGAGAGGKVREEWRRRLAEWPGIDYRRIVLGRVGNRWLTNDEISAGVTEAVDRDLPYHEVGTVG